MDEKEKIKAILDRNSRYDGVFWYGVKSTGIVCKPSCSAKVPLLKNIKLFDRLEDALKSGYRPCKICMKVMKEKNTIKIKRYESPCGVLMLGSFGDKLCLCDWQVEITEPGRCRKRRPCGQALEKNIACRVRGGNIGSNREGRGAAR